MPDTEDDREGADVRWVSYDELASIRGKTKRAPSAWRIAGGGRSEKGMMGQSDWPSRRLTYRLGHG